MVTFNNQTVSRIEGAVNNLLQRVTDGQFPFVYRTTLPDDQDLWLAGDT
jgi:hypothetical protein